MSSPSLDSEISSLTKMIDELYEAYQNANEPQKTKLLEAYTVSRRTLNLLLKKNVSGGNLFP